MGHRPTVSNVIGPSEDQTSSDRFSASLTRRDVLRYSTLTGGSVILGGAAATGNAAAFTGTINDGCVTVCHTAFGFTVCGTVCVDDFGIHDEAELTPSGHNVTVHGHIVGPPGAIATVRTEVTQQSTGAIAEGKTALHLEQNHGAHDTADEFVTQPWTIHAATRGPTRLEEGDASAQAWVHFQNTSIDDPTYSDVIFTWTNDGLSMHER